MRNPFAAGVGGVLSADIAVPDHERELGFYAKVLTTGRAPLWRDDLTNNQVRNCHCPMSPMLAGVC